MQSSAEEGAKARVQTGFYQFDLFAAVVIVVVVVVVFMMSIRCLGPSVKVCQENSVAMSQDKPAKPIQGNNFCDFHSHFIIIE